MENKHGKQGFKKPVYVPYSTMIHKLRRKKRLNNKALRTLLGPVIEHLDLGSVFLTEGSMKIVTQKCPHLKVLILRDCGYVLTDHYLEWLIKVGVKFQKSYHYTKQ